MLSYPRIYILTRNYELYYVFRITDYMTVEARLPHEACRESNASLNDFNGHI